MDWETDFFHIPRQLATLAFRSKYDTYYLFLFQTATAAALVRQSTISSEAINSYDEEDLPRPIAEKEVPVLDRRDTDTKVKLFEMDDIRTPEQFADFIEDQPWGEAITDVEEYLGDMKREAKNYKRKMRRQSNRYTKTLTLCT